VNPASYKNENWFIVKYYFDKLRELLMQLDIMDNPERIYGADLKEWKFFVDFGLKT
jgi:hypothetical protein